MKTKRHFLLSLFLSSVIINTFCQEIPKREIDLEKFANAIFSQPNTEANYNQIYESLFQYYRNPLDINKANKEDFAALYFLSPLQINELMKYRNQNGDFISEYELQAVPNFDLNTIEKLLPFVSIKRNENITNLKQSLVNSDQHYLICSYEQTLEPPKGFVVADSLTNQKFLGNRGRYFLRYALQKRQHTSFGFTAASDVGEPVAWNPANKQYGMDFYSGHLAFFNRGKIKNLTLGDYNVMIGQGLVMSAGYFLGKGAETVTTIKRGNAGIRPYAGSLASGFLRGIATTLELGNFEMTSFMSHKRLDGNITFDTLNASTTDNSVGTALYYSGLHRTKTEIKNKETISQKIAGTHLVFNSNNKNLRLGVNAVYTNFNPAISNQKSYYPYFYKGNEFFHVGSEFNYYWENLNFFGEFSHASTGGNAFIAGLVASLMPTIDFSMLVRNYDGNFYSFYGNSFGEISSNRNEKGIYWGIKFIPTKNIVVNGYFDKFVSPTSSFRTGASSDGFGYLLRSELLYSKTISFQLQYREEQKMLYQSAENAYFLSIYRNFFGLLNYEFEKWLDFQSRIQFTNYKYVANSKGFAIMQDINFKIHKKLKVTARFSIFDTEDYASRAYVMEKNPLWSFGLQPYYGVGTRNYMQIQYKMNKKLDIWLKLARFDYRFQDAISSGINEISGNSKTEFTAQLKYDF
jgi:hypothetical protein